MAGLVYSVFEYNDYRQQTQQLIDAQRSELENTKIQIESLAKEAENSKKQQDKLEKKITTQTPVVPDSTDITSSEISSYLTGVVRLKCWTTDANGNTKDRVQGSGTLMKFEDGPHVLTNKHVAIGEQCLVDVYGNTGELLGIYSANLVYGYLKNNKDYALLKIDELLYPTDGIISLNTKILSLPFCQSDIAIGSSVVTIGYPASTQTESSVFVPGKGTVTVANTPRTVSNGIVSAYDTTSKDPYTGGLSEYSNYYVSAKIDSGNSGGIAFSKEMSGGLLSRSNRLCVLGIPTWLNVGNYDTQGLVQNINNIMSK